MNFRKTLLMASVAVFALGVSNSASAETLLGIDTSGDVAVAAEVETPVAETTTSTSVETNTYVKPAVDGENTINLKEFDINEDGKYSMAEVGERLFYAFDLDGNEVIDNMEWDKKSVMTVVPMEKETFQFVDLDGDTYTDVSSYSYETFYKDSGLASFDENKDGLSAKEFIGVGFEELDDSEDKTITLEEWQKVYLETHGEINVGNS